MLEIFNSNARNDEFIDLNASNATAANRYVVLMLCDASQTARVRGLSFLSLFCEFFLIYPAKKYFADVIEIFIFNARSA